MIFTIFAQVLSEILKGGGYYLGNGQRRRSGRSEDVPAQRTRRSCLKGVIDMLRVRCPECGTETEVVPHHGEEVVAAYCLRHRGGADSHTRPVFMVSVRVEAEPVAAALEPIAA